MCISLYVSVNGVCTSLYVSVGCVYVSLCECEWSVNCGPQFDNLVPYQSDFIEKYEFDTNIVV